MASSEEELASVVAFRDRLISFVNLVVEGQTAGSPYTREELRRRVASEQGALLEEHGRVYSALRPYGVGAMKQFGGTTSEDVVRDTIGRLDHPTWPAFAGAAAQHLAHVIGRMRASLEDERRRLEGRRGGLTEVEWYKATSPLFWVVRLVALVRWLLATNRGRIVAAVSALVLAVVYGIASGAGKAVVDLLLGTSGQ